MQKYPGFRPVRPGSCHHRRGAKPPRAETARHTLRAFGRRPVDPYTLFVRVAVRTDRFQNSSSSQVAIESETDLARVVAGDIFGS